MNRLYEKVMRLTSILISPISTKVLANTNRTRVVVVAEEQILLQRTSTGHQQWSLPGGGIKGHEKSVTAACREVAEETGLQLKESGLQFLGTLPMENASGKVIGMGSLQFYVAALQAKSIPRISRPFEILEVAWFPITDLPPVRSRTVDRGLRLYQTQLKKRT